MSGKDKGTDTNPGGSSAGEVKNPNPAPARQTDHAGTSGAQPSPHNDTVTPKEPSRE